MNPIEIHDGREVRRLDPLHMTLARPRRMTALASSGTDIIPESQWQEVDLETFLGPVTDQGQVGECNAATTAEIVMGARAFAGLPYVPLSAADLYKRINGGSDNGSMPEDALDEATKNGIAPVSVVPFTDWRGSYPAAAAERGKYKIIESYNLTSVPELVSALLEGFFINWCMAWTSADSNPDSQGRIPDHAGSPEGGHSITGCGLKKFDGVWYVKLRNHWRASWGVAGCFYIPLTRVQREFDGSFRMWACRATVQEDGVIPAPVN